MKHITANARIIIFFIVIVFRFGLKIITDE